MLEKEKIVQGIYVDIQDNTTWLESRINAELCKKYGTGEDFSKNPRFKKIGEFTKAHLENLQENTFGLVTEGFGPDALVRKHTEEEIDEIITNKKKELNPEEHPTTILHRKKQADYIAHIEEQERQGAFKDNPFFNILETYDTFTKNDYTQEERENIILGILDKL